MRAYSGSVHHWHATSGRLVWKVQDGIHAIPDTLVGVVEVRAQLPLHPLHNLEALPWALSSRVAGLFT